MQQAEKSKKMRMLVVCPHPQDMVPGQRLKYEQYFNYFRENNIEVTVKPFMTVRFQNIVYRKGRFLEKVWWTIYGYWIRLLLLFSLRRYDVTYLFLWVTPFGPPVFEWFYWKLSRKVIYDIDDLVYLPGIKSDVNPVISGIKGRNKPLFLMKRADHVITCTPYLDEIVRKYNKRTTDISSTINTTLYRPKSDYSIKQKVILGWSGSVSTIKHLRVLEPVLHKLKEEGLCFKLLVMGEENFNLDGIETEALAWKESYEVEVIKRFDLNLFETGPKLQFNKGFMTVLGFDARHYVSPDRRSIFAVRLTGATSLGSERILYYLGGVDGWISPKFNDGVQPDPDVDYAYQALAVNLRGFSQNVANGNNAVVVNS